MHIDMNLFVALVGGELDRGAGEDANAIGGVPLEEPLRMFRAITYV